MQNESDIDVNRGEAACAIVIAALEAELARAERLRSDYANGALEHQMLVPVRHFCATLVESAIEVARAVAQLTSRGQSAERLTESGDVL
jgi:hypothetical protein